MNGLRRILPAGPRAVVLDVIVLCWAVGWIALGAAVGHQVRGLRTLSGTVSDVGVGLEQTGSTLAGLDGVPVVGRRIADAGRQVQSAGQRTLHSGGASRSSVRNLAWMLALAIAVIPSVPILVVYLPLRVLDARERRRLRVLISRHGGDPEFQRYLAHRALFTAPYRSLQDISRTPWREYAAGRFDALAEEELLQAGVDPAALSGLER